MASKKKSGPSGPNVPDSQRRRPPLRLTLSPEAHEVLAKLTEKSGTSRSRLIEALILALAPHRSAVLGACAAARAALARLASSPPEAAHALDLAESWAKGERPRQGEDTDVFMALLRAAIDAADRAATGAPPNVAAACELAADAADSVNDPRLAASVIARARPAA